VLESIFKLHVGFTGVQHVKFKKLIAFTCSYMLTAGEILIM